MNRLILVLAIFPAVAIGQDAPFECDNNFDECGTPEMSGGGNAGGGSILINNTDLGDTYQSADDYDDDGVEDSYDNCPRERNSEQFDSDGDGVGDFCDNCRNTSNSSQYNLDGDRWGDLCDNDIDGDDVGNSVDNCERVSNPGQLDTDGDTLGDACDSDLDGDGIDNLSDPCPMVPDGDGTEDECYTDGDMDGIRDYGVLSDNCIGVSNPNQYDTDLDGTGDACDVDADGDMVANHIDNCQGIHNPSQIDADRDGRGDEGCDDHFCYVVFGDEENCLDPNGAIRIYSPNIAINTGDTAILRLFSNKPESKILFTWSIRERANGSGDVISSPVGRSSGSAIFEHILESRPTFSPKTSGKYIFNISAEFENGTIVQHDLIVIVSGSNIDDSIGGCNISYRSNNLGLMYFMILMSLIARRKYLKA
jgi:hypothetical protein